MTKGSWFTAAMGSFAVGVLLAGSPAFAGPVAPTAEDEIRALKGFLARQAEELRAQRQALEVQRHRLEQLERQVEAKTRPMVRSAVFVGEKVGTPRECRTRRCEVQRTAEEQKQRPAAGAKKTAGKMKNGAPLEKVGKPPKKGPPSKKKKPPKEIAGVTKAGGVLTRRGNLIVEPQIQYSQSNINRFFFQGIEVVDTVLIGQIEATDADRDTLIFRGTARYGITDRLEADVRIPFVYRSDRVTNQIVTTSATSTSELDNADLGDIEVSGRYQINEGGKGWPIFVGGLRLKTRTGTGPFEVSRDANGIETDLPTGSGFWGIEPGITAIYASDPAVFFANARYLAHLKRSIDKTVGGNLIGEVDPGDVVGITFGMGIGLNERTSFSIGYEHSFIGETTTEINGVEATSQSLDVGAVLLGFTHVLSDTVSVNVTAEAGITDDAPDVVLTLRVPVRFDLFK